MTSHGIEVLREKISGRRVIASVSGGKDSAAMSLYLHELGIEHERVFMDTGWEHPATYEYLRSELTRAIGPITEISAPLKMADLIRKRGIFPSKRIRFCTQELKVFPMQRHINALVDAGEDVLNAVGIRKAESVARSKMTEWEWSDGFDCEVWRPIIEWSEQQVIDIHTRHGLRPNPLYLRGASRVGCWPCIYARKSEIKMIADNDPQRIDEIRALEEEVTARRGGPRHFFESHVPEEREVPCGCKSGKCRSCAGDPSDGCNHCGETGACDGSRTRTVRSGAPVPIDQVVAWSRTARGGKVEDKQEELFARADEGCMRWGLCETTGDEK